MTRTLLTAALALALPLAAFAAEPGPANTAQPHPAASAHANAVAGHADAARIEACTNVTTTLVGNLAKGDFKAAGADFNANMAAHLGADKLATVWQQVSQQFGKLQAHGTIQNAMYQGDAVVLLPLRFEKGALNAQVACDADGKIAGFFLRPVEAAAPAAPSASK